MAILVVDATRGEFEMGFDSGGQMREHALLVRSLGVTQLAVAINKLDTVGWSEGRFAEIVGKLGQFLKQAGFKVRPGSRLAHKSQPSAVKFLSKASFIQEIRRMAPPLPLNPNPQV